MQNHINQALEDIKLIVYRTDHIRNDFRNNFKPDSSVQSKIKNLVDECLQTLTADALSCSDLLFEISTCESDDDLQVIIDYNDVEHSGEVN